MKATNTITNNIMKSLIIIVSVFLIQMSSVFAGNNNTILPATTTVYNLTQTLAPSSPVTCDFTDSDLNVSDFSNLAPVSPIEADFSDSEIENINITSLAPVTPSEADFTD